jgi:hypothetical protein
MPNHPDPPSLTLARAIRDLLQDSGATVSDQHAALEIAQHVVNAEYAEEVLGPIRRVEKAERMAAKTPRLLNVDAANPDAITVFNPYGGAPPPRPAPTPEATPRMKEVAAMDARLREGAETVRAMIARARAPRPVEITTPDLASVAARLEVFARSLREFVDLYDSGTLRVTAFDPAPHAPSESQPDTAPDPVSPRLEESPRARSAEHTTPESDQ